jgi:hypothetical protein
VEASPLFASCRSLDDGEKRRPLVLAAVKEAPKDGPSSPYQNWLLMTVLWHLMCFVKLGFMAIRDLACLWKVSRVRRIDLPVFEVSELMPMLPVSCVLLGCPVFVIA